jgi:hypothetical protein
MKCSLWLEVDMVFNERSAVLTAAALVAAASLAFAAPKAPDNRPKDAPVLGHLVMQGRKVTLKAGGLLTVTSAEGRILARDVTLKQLEAVDPALHGALKRTMAGGRDGILWAGLDLPREHPWVNTDPTR